MNKPTKNFAFIDSQNVNLGFQALGWKLDWRRFRVYLREKYGVEKAYLFIGYIPENQQLYTSLAGRLYPCFQAGPANQRTRRQG